MSPRTGAAAAIAGPRATALDGYESLAAETAELSYAELRKRERPFVLPLDPGRSPSRSSAPPMTPSYKGVTDAPDALPVAQAGVLFDPLGGRAGLSPNFVTAIGAILCVLAFILFWRGEYWWGVLSGFIFMVLDTVDGKLARCTGASSKWGNVFDHGIDLIHPPFWWWAWLHGLDRLRTAADAGLRDHGAVGDHRRLCRSSG